MSRTICCTHQQLRIDSPEPPSRPPPSLASIESIFAAAILPEGHPHAPKSETERKPKAAAEWIVKSPGMKEKIRLKLGKKSMWSLNRESLSNVNATPSIVASGQFDADAKTMTSQEVVQLIVSEGEGNYALADRHERRLDSPDCVSIEDCNESPADEQQVTAPAVRPISTDGATPIRQNPCMGSLDWLGSLSRSNAAGANVADVALRVSANDFAKLSLVADAGPSIGSPMANFILPSNVAESNVSDIAFRVAANGHNGLLPQAKTCLPSAATTSCLTSVGVASDMRTVRRTKSAFGIGSFVAAPSVSSPSTQARAKSGSRYDFSTISSYLNQPGESVKGEAERSAAMHSKSRLSPPTDEVAGSHHVPNDSLNATTWAQPELDHVYLHDMDISQTLRSMSQMTDTCDNEDALHARPLSWNFHKRERSDIRIASQFIDRHTRIETSLADTVSIPPNWSRKQTPVREMSPSIYSRPCSAENEFQEIKVSMAQRSRHDSCTDLATGSPIENDWPLNRTDYERAGQQVFDDASPTSSRISPQVKPLPSLFGNPGSDTKVVENNSFSSTSLPRSPKFSDLQHLSKSSSASPNSKTSRQRKPKEHHSPPKKTVRKRRSFFKFLRPASRRAMRCASSPIFRTGTIYDGPTDDRELVTVQYELSEQLDTQQPAAIEATRSEILEASKQIDRLTRPDAGVLPHTQFPPPSEMSLIEARRQSSAPNLMNRRQSLAEYERNLTLSGDNRRRPSALDLQKLQQIQEEDREGPLGLRRKLSRANAVAHDANPLMASALMQHQQEKAMFCSESKRRESIAAVQLPLGDLRSSPFSAGAKSLPPSIMEEPGELLDPLEKAELAVKAHSHLGVPHATAWGHNKKRSATGVSQATSAQTGSTASLLSQLPSARLPTPTIGTELDSWSRFASHTRTERCGSAGKADAVSMNDFAMLSSQQATSNHQDDFVASPLSKSSTKGSSKTRSSKKSPKGLRKSTSMSFSNIIRYYHDIFTNSGFTGKNRRTSVSVGGTLQHPELEMLPPTTGMEHHHNHHQHLKDVEAQMWRTAEGQQQPDHFGLKHDQVTREISPFRHGSIFSAKSAHASPVCEDPSIPPGYESKLSPVGRRDSSMTSENMGLQRTLDGTHEAPATEEKSSPASKAEAWSEVYKECIVRPNTAESGGKEEKKEDEVSVQQVSSSNSRSLMSPPPLRPMKPRSPEAQYLLDPNLRIRKYPSVTVLDDRKGHVRSVSMISSQSLESMKSKRGLLRTSTYDLLEMIQQREQQERERLLSPVTYVS